MKTSPANSGPHKRWIRLVGALLLTPYGASSQQGPPRKAPSKVPAAKAAAPTEAGKFKGIWEPVNYKEDLQLNDVFFVTPDVGYVSGAAGTILKTTDGGATWTAQLGGDPQAQGPDLTRLHFFNETHGWAQSWNQLFRTTDGENWQPVGQDVRGPVFFTSESRGFRIYGGHVFKTEDGGHDWKVVFFCRAKMEVGGLTQDKSATFGACTSRLPAWVTLSAMPASSLRLKTGAPTGRL